MFRKLNPFTTSSSYMVTKDGVPAGLYGIQCLRSGEIMRTVSNVSTADQICYEYNRFGISKVASNERKTGNLPGEKGQP
jgi:hypothetical protein